ncbi:MAG: hypothetical protein ACLQEQ_01915 [Nitrososphaerales archaeon]
MQRAKAVQIFEQDRKEAISDVKGDEYRRELGNARNLVALGIIEHKIRTDFQLTMSERLQLLAEVECATALAG